MDDCTARREAERAGFDSLLDDLGHLLDVFRCSRLVLRAALAHHVDPHGAMSHLRADIDGEFATFESIKILGKGFPLPLHPFGKGRARDVFNAFHQLDEVVALIRRDRSETDAAIAEDDTRDAMQTGRR